jgi:c-di-GMP-binding flagellar brake protein YcgR
MTEEQRTSVRKPLGAIATLITKEGTQFDTRTIDLSAGGACVLSDEPMTPGQQCVIVFEVSVDDTRCIAGRAEVVYCVPFLTGQFRSGLKFTELQTGTRDVINKFLAGAW